MSRISWYLVLNRAWVLTDDILLPSLCSNAIELSTTYVYHHDCSHMPQNPLHTFPHNFLCRRGSCQLAASSWATSHCNGIWETTRHNRHSELLPAPTCYRRVADLLRVSRQLLLSTDIRLARGNWCNGFWPLAGRPLRQLATHEGRSCASSYKHTVPGGRCLLMNIFLLCSP